ncbi:hypothetical protein D3OALGA1CA_1693 [Olavius algarvensis associated proteobacterium Delta 3]|nr:hypothetical protein D3OALGA1CA_1693 [Olavius algarvensis associated proteobacterium Delta 3]CAB5112588.1 hypothetical protein D3OALGB2SA_2494 [Olavius algarvensis associated proteobacterium Delta 3]
MTPPFIVQWRHRLYRSWVKPETWKESIPSDHCRIDNHTV